MLRRPFLILGFLLALAIAGGGAVVHAQLETGERGILPIDSSGTLEIGGIHVDVGGKDSMSARYAGWRVAQRAGFKALWAKTHEMPIARAPNLPDSTLDGIVSAINVEREQIGPNRYIADLGIQFDRARAAPYLGVEGGEIRRSIPMLVLPILVSGGTATAVELRNGWQRAWAQFRTNQSPIDYVRVSGMGVDPLLINASQVVRPGRGWWRNLLDLYGAADILVAEVQLQHLYPGGPARARFIARHGPDQEIVGGFTLIATSGDKVDAMMAEGVRRMDTVFAEALAAGRLQRDSSLDLPPPPIEELAPEDDTAGPDAAGNAFQVQVSGRDVNSYNFAMAHLRTLTGIDSASPQQINPGGTSYILVRYHGSIAELAAALGARGWQVEAGSTFVKIRSNSDKPPALPPPPPPPVVTPPAPEPQQNSQSSTAAAGRQP